MGYLVQKMNSEYTQQLEESKAYTIALTNNFYSYSSDDQPEIHCFGPVKDNELTSGPSKLYTTKVNNIN